MDQRYVITRPNDYFQSIWTYSMGSTCIFNDRLVAYHYGIHNVVTAKAYTSTPGRSSYGQDDGILTYLFNLLNVIISCWFGYILGLEQRFNDTATIIAQSTKNCLSL
jgi:hypothetical protein